MVGLKLIPDQDIPGLFNLDNAISGIRTYWFGCTTHKGIGGYWYHNNAYGYYKSNKSILFIIR